MKRISERLPRVVIEGVTPQIDGGRHPVKRIEGARCDVGAIIYKDGHDLLGGRLLYRKPGARSWQHAPLNYDYDSDRWSAQFLLDRTGRWRFTVEAWPDEFGSWRHDLQKRVEAGQDIAGELQEGARVLTRHAAMNRGAAAKTLTSAAATLADTGLDVGTRLTAALAHELAELTRGPADEAALARYERELEIIVDRRRAEFSTWYELFPRSQSREPGRHGTFADVERRLPALADLGFDVVYLPPIHPIGRTHRKGPNNVTTCGPDDPGSPWAIGGPEGGHTAIHPELGTIEDFDRMVRRAAELGLEFALDYALQCSPDHPWAKEHPDWFHVRADGTIRYAENPPKKYQDIYPLNFWCKDRRGLWNACRDVLVHWIEHGVRIFRVDNPHTKPFAFWEWMIADVTKTYPDVIFLAEAFTRPNRMKGLAKLGFNQSYTYFTWKNSVRDLREYLGELATSEMNEYYRPNLFANTPDILHAYLQEGGPPAFRVRLLLAATLSPIYGIYSGFELCENVPVRRGSEEYLHSEKYEIVTRDWDVSWSLAPEIALLNRIRRDNPSLQRLDSLSFVDADNDRCLCYRRSAPGNELLITVNLDAENAQESFVYVPVEAMGLGADESYVVEDLLTGVRYTWRGSRNYIRLDPAERAGHILRVVGSASGRDSGRA